MKRWALGLLLAAAALYAFATARGSEQVAWGYVAAFAEAAMVGALADWFAVVALFRRPLGLPIPHTAVIPRHKDRIGRALGTFLGTHFLATDLVAARLREFDGAARLARWLAEPRHAMAVAWRLADVGAWMVQALDDARVHRFVTALARRGLRQVDVALLSGQLLQALTQERRHQELLDAVLAQLARLLGDEAVQEGISDTIARELRTLRLLRLDQVAARLATRKVIVIIARTLIEMAEDPRHRLRLRFDASVARWAERLQDDESLRQRGERLRDRLLQQPALARYVHQLWSELLAWLQQDLRSDASWLRQRLAQALQALGERLAGDAELRAWIDGELQAALPGLIERHRNAIVDYVEARVQAWDAGELSAELERHIGRDLQFIRINGTLVGGLVGLVIHAVTRLF
ncbi:MAG TPA: DUF445 domain-containing protein [Ottowia sp.]|uniref:DUF445 domain-containing protein n=1 Tax=Ottowia sp. TaxID=1898956 RepID=UPI002BD624EE|nr:DUF445 domain-containing protein [Ottowia sp.]HMN19852.1 DUF445 domain-containing protein [Ottowia sp.]